MKSALTIKTYSYNKEGLSQLLSAPQGTNWPHVYLIHDDANLYVGETQSIYNRTRQHLEKNDVAVKNKKSLIETISDSSFNKSAILDVEQQLIQLFSAENKFKLLNGNGGQSCLHDYYQKDYYHNDLLEAIWEKLIKQKLATKPIYLLKNLDIFKYSPYVSLTQEQFDVCETIMLDMLNTLPLKTGTFIVNGSAGTGKTVLSIFMLSILKDLISNNSNSLDSEEYDSLVSDFNRTKSKLGKVLIDNDITKIGFVVPMESLRKTLAEVFRDAGLKSINVIGPDAAVVGNYDILFVDEAHRLSRYKNISYRGTFKDKCAMLGLDYRTSNQLEWLMKRSKYIVLFYDEAQTVKGSDIPRGDFVKGTLMHDTVKEATLTSQLRVSAGGDYINYIDSIFSCCQKDKKTFDKYQVSLCDDINDLVNIIQEKENSFGLSRLIAGYGWKWNTKDMEYDEIIKSGKYDIDINGTHLIWNTTSKKWINSEHAKDEVGCIHTTQGYDLRYAGVIFGPEIDYDPKTNEIIINKDNFYDAGVKNATDDKQLKEFIVNSYRVIMKRGIQGTFIYAVNDNLKQYLSKYFDKFVPETKQAN